MQKKENCFNFSASDLVNFVSCKYRTYLDHIQNDYVVEKEQEDEYTKLIQQKGLAHEINYLNHLKKNTASFIECDIKGSKEDKAKATLTALSQNAKYIYQASFFESPWFGIADFLIRTETPSKLGNYSYEILDTKLALSSKTSYIIQLCLYSELLASLQGVLPKHFYVLLGNGKQEKFLLSDFYYYFLQIKNSFESFINNPLDYYPYPNDHCGNCAWHNHCKEKWLGDEHLSLIANIKKPQVFKLNKAGINKITELVNFEAKKKVPKLAATTFQKIQDQARLQLYKLQTGENKFEFLNNTDLKEGLNILPIPDPGDVFFDIEGDPLVTGGLEYLLGLFYFDNEEKIYLDLWAHNEQEEKKSFEALMDFFIERIKKYPNMHIYHYAPYETTAIKRLMSKYGTKEASVDFLLRRNYFVDLYQIVRQDLRISEPKYSIKNLELFYIGHKREGEVASGGESIVIYEKWVETKEQKLLDNIKSYNLEDCESTWLLREWLLSLKPKNSESENKETLNIPRNGDDSENIVENQKNPHELRLDKYKAKFNQFLPEDSSQDTDIQKLGRILYYLMDFHRREDKPGYWSIFDKEAQTAEELLEDPEALAGITLEPDVAPLPEKRSFIYTYTFPEQEHKIRAGKSYKIHRTKDKVNVFSIDDENRRILFKSTSKLPENFVLIPNGPLKNDTLKEAIFRVIDHYLRQVTDKEPFNDSKYRAIYDALKREYPKIKTVEYGTPILTGNNNIKSIVEAANNLDNSYLFIQGPPGTGKTWVGSHLIMDLIKQGYKIGVTSNSHKAINNLLLAVEKVARETSFNNWRGLKKSNKQVEDELIRGKFITDVFENKNIFNQLESTSLIAGTAWLFAEEELDQKLDYLFIDEAGQISLANFIVLASSAKNIILLGDHMQLAQPIQGVHPHNTDQSILEYLLDNQPTIPLNMGIFLNESWRMHPDICTFISKAVYEDRLHAHFENIKQSLILTKPNSYRLKTAGINFIPIEHQNCSQSSQEEVDLIKSLLIYLTSQHFINKKGDQSKLSTDNILIIAPYNQQVSLLKQKIQNPNRIGTIDKFQG